MSSSKQNSSLKEKDRNSIMKNYINTESGRKNDDLASSVSGISRSSVSKSISKNSSFQPSVNSSRNNSTFFKEKDANFNVKEL